jgi:nucleoid-associated protein YgaU
MDVAPAVEPSRGAGAALPPAPQPPAAPAEQVRSGQETSAALKPVKATRFHIVREGETLSSIAARYYGNAAAVRKLIEANRETVKDPDRIRPGIKIIIPD